MCATDAGGEREFVRSATDGALIRFCPSRTKGGSYRHVCQAETYELVAHAADELASGGFTLEEIAAHIGRPHTQVAVALAFLKERGCVHTVRRRNFPTSDCTHLDAMIEIHALREERA